MKVFPHTFSNPKRVRWLLTFVCASCWAYALVVRYTSFFMAPRLEKLLLILTALLITLVISFFINHDILPKIIRSPSNRQILTISALSFLSTVFIMVFFYELPYFPQNHRLEIQPINKDQLLVDANQLEIISITRIELPGNQRVVDSPTELIPPEVWNIGPQTSIITWTGISDGSVIYSRFMQAGIEILFRSGPQQGLTRIIWDDQETILDLNAPAEGLTSQVLQPSTSWRRADTTRKWLVGAAFLADFIGLFVFLNILGLIFYGAFFRQGLHLRSVKFITISCALLLLSYPVMSQLNPSIEFSDAGLESAIRDTLGLEQGVIHQHDILSIFKLDASGKEITELDGIQRLRNITSLNLAHNKISDISALGALSKLRDLDLSNNSISDISSLASLNNLESLNLGANRITDILPISILINLRDLNLRQNTINDISTLSHLFHLEKLNLRANRIHDITPIDNLRELHQLNLRQNSISDIRVLDNLKKLKTLNLHSNKISEISSLKSSANLIDLNLGQNNVMDIDVLINLVSLKNLNLKDNSISDISPIANLTKLQSLNLGGNTNIPSITPLASLTDLRSLNLRNVPVGSQVELLSRFTNLSRLNLRNANISDIAPLATLMASGALQSSLDIRDNPIPRQPADGYAALRHFWDAIPLRAPFSLPVFNTLPEPVFSHSGGFFPQPFSLSISSSIPQAAIHYTLDGSEPTPDSPIYTQPIPITSRSGEPNILSNISTTSYEWQEPLGEVFQATVVRAALFLPDGSRSAAVTHTFFVDEDMTARYNLPIVSLVTDLDNFFNPHFGIYVLGAHWDKQHDPELFPLYQEPANFNQRGRLWERPANFEFFDKNGHRQFTLPIGVRIHGGVTRRYPQKTLRLVADDWYDKKNQFSFNVFSDVVDQINQEPISDFKILLLRNSGNDWRSTMLRDAIMQSVVSHTSLDIQAYRPTILFINGEYWGIHNLRERMDAHYLAAHYLVSPQDVVILENNALLDSGIPGDQQHYLQLINYLDMHNINDSGLFEYVSSQMDMDNYIDYLVTQIYINNTDWPHNNVKFWRYRTDAYEPDAPYGQDGRWRWFLFDTDYGFKFVSDEVTYKQNTLLHALHQSGRNSWSSFLFKTLIQNKYFDELLITRFADHLNTSFEPQRVIGVIDEMQAVIAPEMPEHIRRWRTMDDSVVVWEENVEVMRTFARHRPDYVRQHLMEYFDLPGTAQITLQSDPSMGYIRINSIDITADTPGVTNPSNWRGIYFQGIPVTISAIPHLGFRFAGWQGSSQQEPSITLIPDQDIILQAVFLPIDD